MPLKHPTETMLIAFLGLATVLTGIVIAVLSVTHSPWFLWIGAFFVSLLYPMLLYPHFRERRADYEFRLLHFVPALLLLLWLVLRLFAGRSPLLGTLLNAVTFGWSLILVSIVFALLGWFSMTVIRQWPRRIGLLMLIFLPFALLGIIGERAQWEHQLAALLEPGTQSGAAVSSRPILVAHVSSSSALPPASSVSSRPVIAVKPPQLPHAGGGIEFFVLLVPAATCASVQVRTMRRNCA